MNKDVKYLQEAYSKIKEHVVTDIVDLSDEDISSHSDSHHDEEALSMAKTQLLNIMHNVQEILDVIDDVNCFEPWMTGMLANADGSINKLKEVVLFRE